MRKQLLNGALVLTAAAGFAIAGPLDKRIVAPDAKWVVHVDIEAVRDSTLCKFLVEQDKKMDAASLNKMKKELGLDPLKDLKSLTVYGASPDPEKCIAVIKATDAVDGLLTKLVEEKKELTKSEEGPYTIYTWAENGEQRHAFVKRTGDERTIVAATEKANLLSGIRQLEAPRGEVPKEGALAKSPRAGSMVFVAGTSMEGLKDGEASMVLQKAESLVLDIGETAEEVYADVRLTTASSEEATNMLMVAQGGIGLARMYSAKEPELKCFAGALEWIKLDSDGPTLRARVTCSSKDLREFLTNAAKAAEEAEKAEKAEEADEDAPAGKPKKPAAAPKRRID